MTLNLASLTSSNWRERKQAIESLAHVKDASLARGLLDILRQNHHNLSALNAALQLLHHLDAPVVPGLVELLSDSDPDTRTYVALALGQMEDPQARSQGIPALLDLLREGSKCRQEANLCFNVIEALGKLRARQAVEPLLEIVQKRDFYLAFPAVHALGEIADTRALPHLLELLDDELLGAEAVRALGKIGGTATLVQKTELAEKAAKWLESPLGEAAPAAAAFAWLAGFEPGKRDRPEECREIERLITSQVGPTGRARLLEAVPTPLDPGLPPDDAGFLPHLARVLGWLLGKAGEKESAGAKKEREALLDRLVTLLHHPASQIEAAEALARSGRNALPELIEQFSARQTQAGQSSQEARHAIARALAAIADPAAIPALTAALDSSDGELVMAAADALGKIRHPSSFEPLVSHLAHPSPGVRKSVMAAIQAIGHPDHTSRMLNLLQQSDPVLREAALCSLAHAAKQPGQTQAAISAVLAAMADSSPGVRRAAVEAAAYFEDPHILPAMAEAIQDSNTTIRVSAVRALAHVAPEHALPFLYGALRDSDAWVRMYACRSLGQHARSESLAHISLLKNDSMPPVRIAVAEALGQIGGPRALSDLRTLLSDPDPEVQRAAEQALAFLRRGQQELKYDRLGDT